MTNALRDDLVSIIIPAKNEAENLPALFDEIEQVLAGQTFEVLCIDDGSTDATPQVLADESQKRAFDVRHIRHDKSSGKSLALRSGALAARGWVCVTLDADGQNDPKFLMPMVEAMLAKGDDCALCAGQREKHAHSTAKRYASKFANGLRSRVLGDHTRDTACGLKAIRTDVFRILPFFEGSHRFLPALVIQERYAITHIDVVDRPRMHGTSHYGIFDRGLQGAGDLLGVWWLKRRRRKMPKVHEVTGENDV